MLIKLCGNYNYIIKTAFCQSVKADLKGVGVDLKRKNPHFNPLWILRGFLSSWIFYCMKKGLSICTESPKKYDFLI
jgi:hypothetical protein